GAQQTFIATIQQFASDPTGSQGVNLATRRRQSDESGNPGGPGNNPGSPPQPQPISGPVMVLPDGRIVAATPTGIPASPSQPQPPPGALANGFPPGFQPPSGIGIQQGAAGVPPLPGQPGFQNTPNTPIAPPSSAANLINQILTTPRPGGLNGTDPTVAALQPVAGGAPVGGFSGNTGVSAGQSLGGQTIGGGIAGVASKLEQEGIKSYNERTSYDEWEFVYDISKDKSRGGGVALPRPPPQPGQNSPPLNPGSNSTGN
ncbi:MAG TPA: hypothetical protein VFC21_12685, partial [Bryobacteraceae bacterium]|nr:hypothetical protein [Bryobacteraceae bacterium]